MNNFYFQVLFWLEVKRVQLFFFRFFWLSFLSSYSFIFFFLVNSKRWREALPSEDRSLDMKKI